MRIEDGFIKDILRAGVKLIHKRKHDRYVNEIRRRSEGIPEFTLLTSDCMGGLIYHTMGRQFLSPTINLSIRDGDFLKFLVDMPYYFSEEIHFLKSDYFPIGTIGEGDKKITISFEHFKTEEDARSKWDARKNRLTDNIYIVVADQNLTEEQFELFKHLEDFLNIKRKVMFTWNRDHADGKNIFYVKPYGRERIKNWSKLRPDGFRDYEVFFDYVSWLKMQDNFMLD